MRRFVRPATREFVTRHPTVQLADLALRSDPVAAALLRDADLRLTYNGRGAIWRLLAALPEGAGSGVLVPAFHCPTVVEPILRAGRQPHFYAITPQLDIDIDDLRGRFNDDIGAVIVINYFGFPARLDEVRALCRQAGAILIEDCAHSFLAANPVRLCGERGDAAIFSFKKLVPTIVGGGVRLNSLPWPIPAADDNAPVTDTIRNMRRAGGEALDNSTAAPVRMLRALRTQLQGKRRSPPAQPGVAADAPTNFDYPYIERLARSRMPGYARRILAGTSLAGVVARRRTNYAALAEVLHDTDELRSLYRVLPEDVCPWAYPVLLENRSVLDRQLHAAGVPLFTFGETLHPAFERTGAAGPSLLDSGRRISEQILCFSIHQQLSPVQVRAYGETINRVLAGIDNTPGARHGT